MISDFDGDLDSMRKRVLRNPGRLGIPRLIVTIGCFGDEKVKKFKIGIKEEKYGVAIIKRCTVLTLLLYKFKKKGCYI